MYADIAAMCSLFLRLTVNDDMSPPLSCIEKIVRIRSICVVITKQLEYSCTDSLEQDASPS